ncbi:MAG: DUF1294 domain-containing protein [Erysipelotrichaceae bacterium]|nr:DUF1294 domain-containing protein [Erysipelotrichaceae bacterium]
MFDDVRVLYYLLAINAAGLLLLGLSVLLRKKNIGFDLPVYLAAAAGGCLGVLIGILLWDRKAEKENMMMRVFAICCLPLQVLLFLTFRKKKLTELNFNVFAFFEKHMILLWYLLAVNVITLLVFGLDKWKAKNDRYRIKIVTLLGLCFIGGGIGGLLGMKLFNHKTNKNYFYAGVPLILLLHAVILVFLMNL